MMFIVALVSIDGEIIPLKYIESMGITSSMDEDTVIDKLKNDITLRVTTKSGHHHICSMKQNAEQYVNDHGLSTPPKNANDFYNILHKTWLGY